MSATQVKKAAQRADELIREQQRQAAEPASEGESGEQTPAADPAQDTGAEQPAEPTETPAEGDEGTQQPAAAEPAPQAPTQEVDWEHKYRSLDGMLRQRDQKIDQLYELIAAMNQQQQQTTPRTEGEGDGEREAAPMVTKEDETAFGADLIDLARRVTREEFNSLRKGFLEELQGLKGKMDSVESSVKESAQERFEARLDKASPNWRTLDSDPAFLSWLQESPVRHRQFADAVQSLDHVATADLFKLYEQQTAPAAPPAAPAATTRRQAELEKQLAPGKSKSSGSQSAQAEDKKTWTRSEIAQVYADKRNIDRKEFAKLEREISAAQREGRVDFNR